MNEEVLACGRPRLDYTALPVQYLSSQSERAHTSQRAQLIPSTQSVNEKNDLLRQELLELREHRGDDRGSTNTKPRQACRTVQYVVARTVHGITIPTHITLFDAHQRSFTRTLRLFGGAPVQPLPSLRRIV